MSDKVKIGGKQFDTLVAITEDEVRRGLMFKPWPPPVMSFPFSNAEVRKFWMKNTISPLDIIFCRGNKIIGIFAGEPCSIDNIGPDEPCDLVIELPRGAARKYNILIGDLVKLSYSIKTLSKKFKNNY